MNYCFDLDGTICNTPIINDKPAYHEANPIPFMVEQVNRLFDEGHKIIIMTARGREDLVKIGLIGQSNN